MGQPPTSQLTHSPDAGPVLSLDEVGGWRRARPAFGLPIDPFADGDVLRIANLATATIQFHSLPGLVRPAAAAEIDAANGRCPATHQSQPANHQPHHTPARQTRSRRSCCVY
ncbi:MAG: hypothetical protein R3D55_16340 [Chloroflexota bacterium]